MQSSCPTHNSESREPGSGRRRTAVCCLLLAVLSLGSSGCALVAAPFGAFAPPVNFVRDQIAYNDTTDSFVLGWRNHVWSKKAWYQHEELFGGHDYQKDIGKGFRAGYISVANGSDGCPPVLPPREYWSWRYQSPEGQAKTAAWFEGYPIGAAAAEKDGIDNWGFIQTSYTAGSKSVQAREYYQRYMEQKRNGGLEGEEVPPPQGDIEFLDPPPAVPPGSGSLPVPALPNQANPTNRPLPAPAPPKASPAPLPGPKVVPPQPNESRARPTPRSESLTTAPAVPASPSARPAVAQPTPDPLPTVRSTPVAPAPAPTVVIDQKPRATLGGASPVQDAADLPPQPPAILRGNARPLPNEDLPRGRIRGVTNNDDETAPAGLGDTAQAPSAEEPAASVQVPSWWQPARQLALVYGVDDETDQPPQPESEPEAEQKTVSQNPFAQRLAQRLDAIAGARK